MPILDLPQRLTREDVTAWLQGIRPQLATAKTAGQAVQINAAALQQFDSAAVAALLAVRREAEAAGVAFAGVNGMNTAFASLVDVYGVDSLLLADN